MNEKEIALNAAIFAAAKLEDRGSTSYAVKDRSGTWYTMNWHDVIRLLYNMLKEEGNG